MRVLLALASIAMLASAESPTGYSHRSSNPDLNFQPVPSVAQIHIPPSSQTHSHQYVMPQYYSTLEKQNPGPQIVYSPSNSHYTSPSAASSSSSTQQTSSSNQLSQYSPAPQQYASSSQQQSQYAAPSNQYSSQQNSYNAPSQQSQQSQQSYSAPSSSSQNSYSAPSQQQQQSQYSAPSVSSSQQYSSPTNVQVSYGAPQLPQGAIGYGPPPVVTGAGPDHNVEYRVVYVKGPKAPKPDLILPPPPPQQKTLVYILVPRVEPPEPIIVPTHPPTPPSKPEVFFIRYKAPKKARQQQTYSSVPSGSYGAATNVEPVVVEPPTKPDSSSKGLSRKSSSSESNYGDKVTSES